MSKYVSSEKLMCCFNSWKVINEYTLALYLAEGNCCDMKGCIDIGEQIMPEVERIITYSGEKQDTEYVYKGQGYEYWNGYNGWIVIRHD